MALPRTALYICFLPFDESTSMSNRLTRFAQRSAGTLALAAALAPFPAHAVKVNDLQADDMVRAAGHMKDALALSPNQLFLWQQVASKSAAILRVRQARRETLQASLKSALANPRVELRELDGGLDQEAVASAAENRELRTLWLTVNDALNDQQRLAVAQFMLNQLDRVDAPERARGPGAERGEPPQGGQRHQKPQGGGPSRF
jgi:hypothetical protein